MNCPRCRKPSIPDAAYCAYCGSKLSLEKKKCRSKSRGNGTGCAYKRAGSWVAQVIVDWRIPADESKRLIPVKVTKGGFKTRDKALQSSKKQLLETLNAFEKEKKYLGHIVLDVDPV